MACMMSDDARKRLFGALRNAGIATHVKWVRFAVAEAALSAAGTPRTVTTFTTLTDDDANHIVNWLPTTRPNTATTPAP